MHCTPAFLLLRLPDYNCEGKLSLLITAAAEGLIIIDNLARLNVHDYFELLWKGLVIFIGGILKVPSICDSCLAHTRNES